MPPPVRSMPLTLVGGWELPMLPSVRSMPADPISSAPRTTPREGGAGAGREPYRTLVGGLPLRADRAGADRTDGVVGAELGVKDIDRTGEEA